MKKHLLFLIVTILAYANGHSQVNQGTAVYHRTVTIMPRNAGGAAPANVQPRLIESDYELLFTKDASLWRKLKNNDQQSTPAGFTDADKNDVIFTDLASSAVWELRAFQNVNYIITDNDINLKWTVTDETKKIGDHLCQKATAQRIGKKFQISFVNGEKQAKEMPDTANLVAWFTKDIKVSAGPELHGKLPGLIMEVSINNGRIVYVCTKLSNANLSREIIKPSGDKNVTNAEFNKLTLAM